MLRRLAKHGLQAPIERPPGLGTLGQRLVAPLAPAVGYVGLDGRLERLAVLQKDQTTLVLSPLYLERPLTSSLD